MLSFWFQSNVCNYILIVSLFLIISSCNGKKNAENNKKNESDINKPNISTKPEHENEWKLLSDENSAAEDWQSTNSKYFPEHGWSLDDGVLSFVPVENGHGADIITGKKYSDFEFYLEFKIEKEGNSGIKYNVVNNYPGHQGNYLGLEYQILDDKRHPDANKGRDRNRTTASLYDMISPSQDKKLKAPGEWNSVRIVSVNDSIEHWLNGGKVVFFKIGSTNYNKLVEQSKYNEYEGFGEVNKGHILLQGHGDRVSFRDIKIRVLSEN